MLISARRVTRQRARKPPRPRAVRALNGFFITPAVRAFDKPLGKGGKSFHLIAPYEKDPSKWFAIEYVDIYSGESFAISTDH
jgi:hypothetical protein